MNQLPSITQLDLPPRPASRFSQHADPLDSPAPQPATLMPRAANKHAVGLPTPPNSNPTRTYHSFHALHDDEGEQDGLLYPPQAHSLSPASSPRTPPQRLVSAVQPHTTLPYPHFEEMRPLGYTYDRKLLDRIESHTRSPNTIAFFHDKGIQPPTPDDYGLSLSFRHDFSRAVLEVTSPAGPEPAVPMVLSRSSQGRARPRKVLQDSTPNRRAVTPLPYEPVKMSSMASVYAQEGLPSSSPHRRRRSSTVAPARRRANPKPVPGGKEAKSARAKSTKVQKSEDYLDYPDFAPPHEAMRRPMEHAQKAKDYGSQLLDLTNDPHRHLMHEAEILLAQRLHLHGRKYLVVKRQLFEEYVKLLRHESEKQANWNKTAAQRVSNVDVTKTSVVWQFYNDIGWFDKNLFSQWVDSARDLSSEYYPRSTSS